MFATATYSARDPDLYAAAIRAARVEVVGVSRGEFQGSVTRLDLHRVWMQRGEENLARAFRSSLASNRVAVSFLAPGSSPVVRLGMEMSSRQIAICIPEQTVSWRSLGKCAWAGISMTAADLASFSHTLLGRELKVPDFHRLVIPSASLMSNLQRVHAAAFHMAKVAPEVIAEPEVTRGLEQYLACALVACIAGAPEGGSVTSPRQAQVLARFEAVLDANPDRAVYIPEICSVVGVSGRTLRACCTEHLGMSPKHYVDLRRMHLARRALLLTPPGTGTVTEIATRYGFWELGRFAVAYRLFFGESPSETLAHEPELHADTNKSIRWHASIGYRCFQRVPVDFGISVANCEGLRGSPGYIGHPKLPDDDTPHPGREPANSA